MMNFKKLMSLFLAVLMLCGVLGSFSITAFASDATEETTGEDDELLIENYISTVYASPEDKLATMTQKTTKGNFSIYADEKSGEVAVKDLTTGQILFTNPYDVGATNASDSVKNEILSQIVVKFTENGREREYSSYEYAALRDQIKVKNIKNGIRVEYTIGREEARRLVPRMIEKERFVTMIQTPLEEYYGVTYEDAKVFRDDLSHPLCHVSFDLCKIMAYYQYKDLDNCTSDTLVQDLLDAFPIVSKYDIYVLDPSANIVEVEKIEEVIKTACPNYSYEEMDYDHMLTEYTSDEENPPVFKMALEYTLDADGFTVRMPANGIRFNEDKFQLTNVSILPYMGAGNSTYEGYTFYPDGSGALFAFEDLADQNTYAVASKIYGTDYAYHKLTETYQQTVRYPVFGIVENTVYYDCISADDDGGEDTTKVINAVVYDSIQKAIEDNNAASPAFKAYGSYVNGADISERTESRGFVAIIEEGDALTELVNYHAGVLSPYDTVKMNFNPRPKDSYNVADAISVGTNSEWTVVSNRKYVGNYKIHYIMLTDESLAAEKQLKNGTWYESSWLGMAKAYRDYLTGKGVLSPLSAEETSKDIPLYIEAFGAMEVVEKIASIPVEVMKPLTSTQDIITMYEELSGKGATNINFKLTGYANGGMYATVPKNLKWEKAVTKDMSMQELFDYAAGVENGSLNLYPDFDFAYLSDDTMLDGFSLRKHSIRTIDDRISSKREWVPTQQRYGGFNQMVVSPAYYENFYVKFMEKYLEQNNLTGISVGSLGNALNSDFDEDEPYNREDAKAFTTKALEYISGKDDTALEVMVDGGNAYTWQYADHILGAALDSSRYIKASYSVPFVGVVLHGYMNFTGTPLNMEGDVNYAKLKAIENGASLYFTLSYQNTQKLKENTFLSQYYSIRYDIWFDDVVEIYNELNSELKDVQDKVIIDHRFLSGMRVPDVDELDRDLTAEFESVLDFQNNKAEYEEKQKAEAVADARDKIAGVETAARRFVKDFIDYYSGNSGAATRYMNGDRSFERQFATYVEVKAAYDAVKAEYDAADEEGKKALADTLAAAETAEKQALGQVKARIRNVGESMAAIEKEYIALSKLLEDAKAGQLLINQTEGCPATIIAEIEAQLKRTEDLMATTLGVRFNLTVDKLEVDTFLYTHISTLMFTCSGDNSHGRFGIVGKGENIYNMLVNEDYGLLITELELLRYLEANREMTDDQLIAKYGLKADQSSVDGLVLYVKELLGENYQFDPVIEQMGDGIDGHIRDYFVSVLYAQINAQASPTTKKVESSVVPSLNFVPTYVSESGRILPNTTNINNVTKTIDKEITALLTGKKGVIGKVEDGDYTLSKYFSDEDMNKLIDTIVEIIRTNTRTEDNPLPVNKAVEYATPETMREDIRNYVEGNYYRAAITAITPADAGDVTLKVVTVSAKTNSSIEELVDLCMSTYGFEAATKYEDLVKAMKADAELKSILDHINATVEGAYGNVRDTLETAFVKAFAVAAIAEDKAPTLKSAKYEDAEGNKVELRVLAKALMDEKLTAASTDAEIQALIAELVALHADFVDSLPANYDATEDVTCYVYYNLLLRMSELTLKETDNFYYDEQMAAMDVAVRQKAADKVALIESRLPAEYDAYDIVAEMLAVLGDPDDNVYTFAQELSKKLTHTAEGKHSNEDDILSYYVYLIFSSFEECDISAIPDFSVITSESKEETVRKDILDRYLNEDKMVITDLIARAKAKVKRGQMPDYRLENLLEEGEMDRIAGEMADLIIKRLFAKDEDRETLIPEAKAYLQYRYYNSILDMLLGEEHTMPAFHVSDIYDGTLSEANQGIKDLMYYFATHYSPLTEADIEKLIGSTGSSVVEEEEESETSRYLSDDGRIVSVTYGTQNADGSYSAYKTFVLNYNNFAVNVEYEEITYTIPAYGYVVVMH